MLYHGSLVYQRDGLWLNYRGGRWTVNADGILPSDWPRVFLGTLEEATAHTAMLKHPGNNGYRIIYVIDPNRLPDLTRAGACYSWTTSHVPPPAIVDEVKRPFNNNERPADIQHKLQMSARKRGWV